MNILVLGSGGREHSICWSISKSKNCKEIYCIPGNSGIAEIAKCVEINLKKKKLVYRFCLEKQIDLVVIGPENLLEQGMTDYLSHKGISVFGPNRRASKLETSKTFSKKFMKKHNIPTANYKSFDTLVKSKKYIENISLPIVIKVDGLASGKGVIICKTKKKANNELKEIFINKKFGEAGKKILIEEFLHGFELSYFTFVDKNSFLNLGYALDHKRKYDDDKGPNTGGMGAFSPSPKISKLLLETINTNIIKPTIIGIKKDNLNYNGILFFGIMQTNNGPKVVEYNSRFGDPECQTILRRFDGDLLKILYATAKDNLSSCKVKLSSDYSVCIVLASKGYPKKFKKKMIIKNLEKITNTKGIHVFHSATTKIKDNYYSNGGRVLSITSRHSSIQNARKNAYNLIKKINWQNGFYRKDIGLKNIK